MSEQFKQNIEEAREAKDRCNHYAKAAIILAALCALAFFIALLLPPQGEVHKSILQGMGILAGLSASFNFADAWKAGQDAKLSISRNGIEIKTDGNKDGKLPE